MKLAKLDKKLPLRAYPEEELNRVLLTDFTTWLRGVLSLTGETSLERFKIALPAVKELCIGMGFDEIKRMFESYADGKLGLEPIPNYFDRILLGKIVSAWKSQSKVRKTPLQVNITDQEKEKIENRAVKLSLDYFLEHRLVDVTRIYVYDILEKRQYIKLTTEQKKTIQKDAIAVLEHEMRDFKAQSLEEKRTIDRLVEKIQKGTSGKIKIKCKEIALAKFYRELTKGENELNNFIKQFEL